MRKGEWGKGGCSNTVSLAEPRGGQPGEIPRLARNTPWSLRHSPHPHLASLVWVNLEVRGGLGEFGVEHWFGEFEVGNWGGGFGVGNWFGGFWGIWGNLGKVNCGLGCEYWSCGCGGWMFGRFLRIWGGKLVGGIWGGELGRGIWGGE